MNDYGAVFGQGAEFVGFDAVVFLLAVVAGHFAAGIELDPVLRPELMEIKL